MRSQEGFVKCYLHFSLALEKHHVQCIIEPHWPFSQLHHTSGLETSQWHYHSTLPHSDCYNHYIFYTTSYDVNRCSSHFKYLHIEIQTSMIRLRLSDSPSKTYTSKHCAKQMNSTVQSNKGTPVTKRLCLHSKTISKSMVMGVQLHQPAEELHFFQKGQISAHPDMGVTSSLLTSSCLQLTPKVPFCSDAIQTSFQVLGQLLTHVVTLSCQSESCLILTTSTNARVYTDIFS